MYLLRSRLATVGTDIYMLLGILVFGRVSFRKIRNIGTGNAFYSSTASNHGAYSLCQLLFRSTFLEVLFRHKKHLHWNKRSSIHF